MNDPASRLSQPLSIDGVELSNRVFLAPMSGVTDEAFRRRADRHGAGLVVSEMIASGELIRERRNSRLRLRRPDIGVHMVQLAGRDAAALAEAATVAEGEGADIIDINMGCPAKKVTGGYCGSALMREPDHALSLIEAVVAAVKVPVTVKMRLGWDETCLNAPYVARRAEAVGVRMVTVHGRTREQFYKGQADWRAIARVRDAISIPLVANGDISGLAEAGRAMALSGADAVMVGRAHYGRPWLAGEIAAQAGNVTAPDIPQAGAMGDYVEAHYRDMLSLYGGEAGLRHARKHLGWYLDAHAPGCPPEERRSILTGTDPDDVVVRMRRMLSECATMRAAA
jgi:nifR3 family TIM-barrel protein